MTRRGAVRGVQPRRPDGRWGFKPAADQAATPAGLCLGGEDGNPGAASRGAEPTRRVTMTAPWATGSASYGRAAPGDGMDPHHMIGWYEDTRRWEPCRIESFIDAFSAVGDDQAMEKQGAVDRALQVVCDMANSGDINPADPKHAWFAHVGALCGAMDGNDLFSVADNQKAHLWTADKRLRPAHRPDPGEDRVKSELRAVFMAACIRGFRPHAMKHHWAGTEMSLDDLLRASAPDCYEDAEFPYPAGVLFRSDAVCGADGLMLARAEESTRMLDWATPQGMFSPLLALHLLARHDRIGGRQRSRAVEALAAKTDTGILRLDPLEDKMHGRVTDETRLETCPWDVPYLNDSDSGKRGLWWLQETVWDGFAAAVNSSGEADPGRLAWPVSSLAYAVNRRAGRDLLTA